MHSIALAGGCNTSTKVFGQAWAGHKSFARKDGSDHDAGNFRGKSRSNDTHESTTDADERLYRKGNTASELRFMGHAQLVQRNPAHAGIEACFTGRYFSSLLTRW